MTDSLQRQWLILHLLPRYPGKVTIRSIHQHLMAEGYDVSRRTVERDLESLTIGFPIVSNESSKPYGWSWAKDSGVEFPGMDPKTAMTFFLASQYLEGMFPRSHIALLRPWFDRARHCLEEIRGPLAHWTEKVAFVHKGVPMLPIKAADDVVSVVYDSLFNETQFECRYRTRQRKISSYRVSPRALIMRAGVIYLVATLRDYSDLVMLSLHRIQKAFPTALKITSLPDFNLQEYIHSGALNIPAQKEKIEMVLHCDPEAIRHFEETPLSTDQIITQLDNDQLKLCATVQDTMDLRWWLLSQCEGIEVISPPDLREHIVASLNAGQARYARSAG